MIQNLFALIINDLAIAFKNKSIYLIFFIPLFAVLSLKLVDQPNKAFITSLPTWILMSVLLVGLIIMPAQVAEEKEKKLLLGLLQTPMREIEWVLAKLFVGMSLTFTAVVLLHMLGRFDFGEISSYLLFLGAGSFCFSSFGVFLGFLCSSQASARILGVLFYLPLMVPAALADVSRKLSMVAPILPSYQFYRPIGLILLEGGKISDFPLECIYLFLVGVSACVLSIRLMKMRWLM